MFLHLESKTRNKQSLGHKTLDLIYAQSGLLYEIIPNAPQSSFDPKIKPRPHANGIVGCTSAKPADSVVKQVSQLSINQSMSGKATASSQPTQTGSVLSVQSLDQKGNQQPGRNEKNGKNNRKGGNKNKNATYNDENAHNYGGDKQSKRKVKFPCKLCKEDHLTHMCPHMEDASRFIAQGPAVLTNPLPHNKNMNSRTNILIVHWVEIKIRRKPILVMVALTWYVLLRL